MDQVLCHPLIVLELACGTPPAPRERTLGDLKKLQQAIVATTDEIIGLSEREQIHDSGRGAVDMALLASALLTPDTLLWTIDKKLDAVATRLDVAFSIASARNELEPRHRISPQGMDSFWGTGGCCRIRACDGYF
jgi:hypothetical protein